MYVTGADKPLVLDASKSRDPDGVTDVTTYFTWQCEKVLEDDNGVST